VREDEHGGTDVGQGLEAAHVLHGLDAVGEDCLGGF